MRFTCCGDQDGLRALSILNVCQDGYVSTLFPAIAELSAAFKGPKYWT
jgi:hypothetical protein